MTKNSVGAHKKQKLTELHLDVTMPGTGEHKQLFWKLTSNRCEKGSAHEFGGDMPISGAAKGRPAMQILIGITSLQGCYLLWYAEARDS